MSRLAALSVSMLLLLAAFPLISLGTSRGSPGLWGFGLVVLAVGGAIPPARRYVGARPPEPPPTKTGISEDCRVS